MDAVDRVREGLKGGDIEEDTFEKNESWKAGYGEGGSGLKVLYVERIE